MTKQVKGIKIEDLTIGAEYLFEEILLRNKQLTKQLIETLIGIPDISDIKYISVEDVHQNAYENKGVRIDIYIKSQTGVAYIVELQVLSQNSDNFCYPSNYVIREVFEKPVRPVTSRKITRITNSSLREGNEV